MSTFNDRLKERRLLKEWSKTKTAQKLGVSAQRYSNWEYGFRQPDYDMLTKVATLFDTTTDYLTGKTNNPNTNLNNTDDAENQLLVAFRKHTAKMNDEEKQKFQRSLNVLMDAAEKLNKD